MLYQQRTALVLAGSRQEMTREERAQRVLRHGLGPRILRKSGYGYQCVHGRKFLDLNPGYVKIIGPDGSVIDRALTVKAALVRIRKLEGKCP